MMNILIAISSGSLGIFLGAQLTEAVLMVPYWKNLNPNDFFELDKTYSNKIYRFFAPMTIVATIIPIVMTGLITYYFQTSPVYALAMEINILASFVTYFLYFKRANRNFVNRSINDDDLTKL